MADFFESYDAAAPPPFNDGEDDPAADFLAREQNQFAELEDDNFVGSYDFSGTVDDTAQPDYRGGASEDPASELQMNGPTDVYSAVAQVDRQRQEPEKLRLWREQQKEMLEKKDSEEATKIEEWRQQAKKELEDWYKHHDEQIEKAKDTNKVSEAAFIKERDETVPGQQWEKVCRLCEFNPKNSKNTKDITRLRSILLQLKQSPLSR